MEIEARSSHNTPQNTPQNPPVSDKSISDASPDAEKNACDTTNVSERSLALMPVLALPAQAQRAIFSTLPAVLLEQAQRIEVCALPPDDAASFPTSSTRCAPTHLLMLARDICEDKVVSGCELIAYPCDVDGRVASWAQRYACCALNFPLAAQKLRLQIVNEMATLHHIENL